VVREAFRSAEAVFDGPGVLPDHPDEAVAEAWLLKVRAAMWAPLAPWPGDYPQ